MTASPRKRSESLLTYEAYMEEFRTQPPTMQPCEIIDGVTIMPPSPRPLHQIVLENLRDLFHDARRAGVAIRTIPSPMDVLIRRDPLRVRQPDLMVMSAQNFRQHNVPDMPGPITIAPEMVIEVLSPSETRRSLAAKIADFRAIGVAECWIVSCGANTVKVRDLRSPASRTIAVYTSGQDVPSIAFPALRVPVASIFQR